MPANEESLDAIAAEARRFRDGCQSLQLATARPGATPVASYAPYAPSPAGGFYIYVSDLAAHTANLRTEAEIGVMFIESEADAGNIFARKRLTCTCAVHVLPRGSEAFDAAIAALTDRFGETMDYLARLTDFHAVELTPVAATFVKGFAQAYEIPAADFTRIRHINDRGHEERA